EPADVEERERERAAVAREGVAADAAPAVVRLVEELLRRLRADLEALERAVAGELVAGGGEVEDGAGGVVVRNEEALIGRRDRAGDVAGGVGAATDHAQGDGAPLRAIEQPAPVGHRHRPRRAR